MAAPAFRLAATDYVAAIDFGTWGSAVAVCPARQAFADGEAASLAATPTRRASSPPPTTDLKAAYANTIVAFPGEGSVMTRKQHTALLLDGAGNMVCFGTKAVEKAKGLPSP